MTDTLTQWLQVDDDALLYTPDLLPTLEAGMAEVTDEDRVRMLQAAFRQGLLSAEQFMQACLAMTPSYNPVTRRPLSLEELEA